MHLTNRILLRVAIGSSIAVRLLAIAAFADERPASRAIQEEVWAIPVTLPTVAYVVRPVGDGPFPLVVMNHGVSLDQRERSFFPLVEFRDAAIWFARRGYMVVAPAGGYGAAALDDPERGIYSVFYSKIGGCDNPNFRDAGFAAALMDKWIIDYMTEQKLVVPDKIIVVGQSAGGWGALALSSQNLQRYGQSSHLPPAAVDTSTANPTTIARLTNWWRQRPTLAAPPAPQRCGSTPRTTRSLGRPYPGECTTLIPAQAEMPNIISYLRSAVMVIS